MNTEPLKVFFSYARNDEMYARELEKHLSNLIRKKRIQVWYDQKIVPGDEWDKEIKQKLTSSDIILFFISSDFLSSAYINDVEIEKALARHHKGEVKVIPIIVRPVDFVDSPLGALQALPKDARAINTWENKDEAFLDIVKQMHIVVAGFNRSFTESEGGKSEAGGPNSIFYPEWERNKIDEWDYRIAGFKPIHLGRSIVNKVITDQFTIPFRKPLFGKEKVPFELNLDEVGHLRGIEISPGPNGSLTKSVEIRPGASDVTAVYILVTAGKGFRIRHNVEFEGKKIGHLEFHESDSSSFRENLVLGRNVRDFSYKHPELVNGASSQNLEQVWRPDGDAFTFDLLKVLFPENPTRIDYFSISAYVEGVPEHYNDFLPAIQVVGLTYKT